jgi:hypothetical protein
MSLQMVMRYSKHIDGEQLARRANVKREQNAVEFGKTKGVAIGKQNNYVYENT